MGDDARDDNAIENNPGAFAAEQTWPTDAEIKEAAKRKLSGQDEMEDMDTGVDMNIGSFKIKPKEEGTDLTGLFNKMQIAVVGRENQQDEEDSGISDNEEDDEVGDLDEELGL